MITRKMLATALCERARVMGRAVASLTLADAAEVDAELRERHGLRVARSSYRARVVMSPRDERRLEAALDAACCDCGADVRTHDGRQHG